MIIYCGFNAEIMSFSNLLVFVTFKTEVGRVQTPGAFLKKFAGIFSL